MNPPWRLVGSVMKYYRMSYDEVLNVRSYQNILLLNAAIPTEGDELGEVKAEQVHANDFFIDFNK